MGGILRRIIVPRGGSRTVSAAKGYDRWAETYDEQPENAVLVLEARLFSDLLCELDLEEKGVVDVGCGTGRHWKELLARCPQRLVGVDISEGMLQKLKLQYPEAETYRSGGAELSAIPSLSCDVVVSTLALAHMADPAQVFAEWSRVLGSPGQLLITDFHTDAFLAGMRRTFVSSGETIEIEHHSLALDQLIELAAVCGFRLIRKVEAAIDDSVRGLFERDRALDKFKKFKGLRLVYGILLTTS